MKRSPQQQQDEYSNMGSVPDPTIEGTLTQIKLPLCIVGTSKQNARENYWSARCNGPTTREINLRLRGDRAKQNYPRDARIEKYLSIIYRRDTHNPRYSVALARDVC